MSRLFRYRPGVHVEDLELGDCTMRVATKMDMTRYWHMWFRDNRDIDGIAFDFAVPMNPNGDYDPNGIGGKTWGLRNLGDGLWQVSPSIDVLNTGDLRVGGVWREPQPAMTPRIVLGSPHSLWHQTPQIVGVPPGERWITEPA